ncbi:MAG: hypothetical protein ABIN01_22335 [Ferruginibacter sp.]
MKKYLLLFAAVAITATGIAQGNSQGKGNGKAKNKPAKEFKDKEKHNDVNDDGTWDRTQNSSVGKQSKNQPAKVRAAFQNDYPNAGNVVWSKYHGDWTATFNNSFGRSTAIYHANGQRRDTRTYINRDQLPNRTIWDDIFRRDRVTPVGNIVQIQSPSLGYEIFRIGSQVAGSQLQYRFYNVNGQKVQYNY